jgi:hypothetical protein
MHARTVNSCATSCRCDNSLRTFFYFDYCPIRTLPQTRDLPMPPEEKACTSQPRRQPHSYWRNTPLPEDFEFEASFCFSLVPLLLRSTHWVHSGPGWSLLRVSLRSGRWTRLHRRRCVPVGQWSDRPRSLSLRQGIRPPPRRWKVISS